MTLGENIISKVLGGERQWCCHSLKGYACACSERATGTPGCPAIWRQTSARKAWILFQLLSPTPLTCPRWAQLLAAAVTCLGSANRWPWVSGTVPISNVLSSCQTNVLLFSSEIMEHLMHSYKSCQLLQVLSQKGATLERKDGNF